MRVAFTSGSLIQDFDGVSNVVYKYIDLLKAKGVEIIAFSQITPAISEQKVPIFKVPSFAIPLYKRYRFSIFTKSILFRELNKFQPDLIHIHTPDLLGFEAINYGLVHKIPVVATHHTRFDVYLSYYHLSFLTNLAWFWMRKLYTKCNLVFCPSKQVLEELQIKGISNLMLLSHGVDTALFNPSKRSREFRQKLGLENKIGLLFVGRLVWEKDLKILAEAYNILAKKRDVVLILVGEGPARRELERMMPKALFLGQKSSKELSEIYACCDIFVFPSTTETFGLVALEAMASGLPVVGVEAFGLKDLVQDGNTGLLARPKDSQDFALKILRLIDDKVLRAKMAFEAYNFAQTKCWDNIINQVFWHYQNVISLNKKS